VKEHFQTGLPQLVLGRGIGRIFIRDKDFPVAQFVQHGPQAGESGIPVQGYAVNAQLAQLYGIFLEETGAVIVNDRFHVPQEGE
jgi:hypothetical protein